MRQYMFDKEFLKQLDYHREKETYIRITSLSNDEYPREEIIGRATGGSINVDGASAVRRSCSLSMVALDDDILINDSYWCYDNKFKLEIGLKNLIDKRYPDIIWFEMGIYIITSFSKSKNTNNISISLSGKDKMCRLNGEVSGNIMMSTDFGTRETIQKNEETGELTSVIEKLPIYMIIQNAIKEYGQERAENIIINDLDQWGYELWEYRGDEPMYLFIDPNYNSEQVAVINMTFNGDTKTDYPYSKAADGSGLASLNELEKAEGWKFFSMNTLDKNYNTNATKISFGQTECYIAKINYGETAGYHRIPLIYNNDLILNAGETVTSLLDKIKNMLGDFEYFYDLKGRFVFQKKNTYIQELFSPIDGELVTPSLYTSQYEYKFENEELFTAISNSPNINNLKNDFAIWGARKSATGDDLPIHARYAIDKKPKRYCSLNWYKKNENGEMIIEKEGKEYDSEVWDWRELIYQMSLDFYKCNQEDNFLIRIAEANPWFIDGKTGYEQYYSDMQAFWRQLYNPCKTSNDIQIAEIGKFEYYKEGEEKQYWNKQIHLDPNTLNFWIDFLDTEGDLGKYSVKNCISKKNKQGQEIDFYYTTAIGTRSKVVNENSVKSIYYRETPEVLFIVYPETLNSIDRAYMPIWIQDSMEGLFYRSAQGISAISKANELIYQHTATVEGISLTSIPIYYLQPNTRIYIKGQGDYTLDKISYSLAYNGTMTLNGNKILKQFY